MAQKITVRQSSSITILVNERSRGILRRYPCPPKSTEILREIEIRAGRRPLSNESCRSGKMTIRSVYAEGAPESGVARPYQLTN